MKTLYSGLQILLYLLLTLPLASHAQRNIPKVTCIYCGGTGRAVTLHAFFCGGSGLMADPQYQTRKRMNMEKLRIMRKRTSCISTRKLQRSI